MVALPVHDIVFATWQTIYMVFIASFLSLSLGLVVGVALYLTAPSKLISWPWFYRIVGFIVNVTRSVPFIILLIAIIPITRLLVGTSIGTNAAIVPLTLAAIPFYARITETALAEVSVGLVEAALSMGANLWQIIYKVLLPEALPGLIKGATLTIIGLVGYSAMAGTVGGGGLGQLAINYGYERFDVRVMIITVILLVVLVQAIQTFGDYCANQRRFKPIIWLSVALWIGCIGSVFWPAQLSSNKTLSVGVIAGPQVKVMQLAQNIALKRFNLHIKIVQFDDYILPNEALNNGNISANIFQHVPFLDSQIKARGFKLMPIAKTFVYPLGFYSKKIKSLTQLKSGAVVAIPNDPSNEGRALLLLQSAKLIKLKPGTGLFGTPYNIVFNPDHLVFKTLDAAQLPRVMHDATLVALNNNYAAEVGFTSRQALILESAQSPYANVIVVKKGTQHNPLFKDLIAVMHSDAIVKKVESLYPNGGAIPAWKGA